MAVTIRETHRNKDNHGACSFSITQHYLQDGLWCAHHRVHDTMPCGSYKLRCFKVILECPSLLHTLLEIKILWFTENCSTLCGCTNALQKHRACRWGSPLKAVLDSNLLSLYLPSPRTMEGLHTHTHTPISSSDFSHDGDSVRLHIFI